MMAYSAFPRKNEVLNNYRGKIILFALLGLFLICLLLAHHVKYAPKEYPLEFHPELLQNAYSMDHYNNYTGLLNDDLWVFGDKIVYYDFRQIRVAQAGGETLTLVNVPQLRIGFIDRFFYCGQKLYFHSGRTKLYCCDLSTGDTDLVCETEECFDWAVINDMVYYLVLMPYAEKDKAPLHCYDLNTGEDRVISAETSAFGIVDGKLRYVSFRDEYELYEYDAELDRSNLLGSFPAVFGMNCIFNFTRDAVVMGRYGLDNYNHDYKPLYSSKLAVYTISSGETAVYKVGEIQELIACNEYAYVRVSSVHYYRICLSTGEIEQVQETADLGDGVAGIFVDSDDCVYIQQYHVYSEARGAVYRYDANTKETTFLAWID